MSPTVRALLDRAMLLEAALWYAELGFAVFPCKPGGKAPATGHGFKDASTDPATIRRWWTQQPDANIGLPTAGLVVIDVDGADNPWPGDVADGFDSCPLSITPRGGQHYVFRQPPDRAWRNSASKLAPAVDTRAEGGYIVVAPSTVNATPYRWVRPIKPAADLPAPPAWLVDQLDHLDRKPSAPVATKAGAIPNGERNATLASLGGTMRRRGMGQAEILAALRQTNLDRCTPPLEGLEVAQIAGSVARYPANITATSEARFTDYRKNSTDLANAFRLARTTYGDAHYVPAWKAWRVWDGRCWVADESGRMHDYARKVVNELWQEACDLPNDGDTKSEAAARRRAAFKHAIASASRRGVEAQLALAQTEQGIPAAVETFDARPMLLTVNNGTIDLETGKLRRWDRSDYLTKQILVDFDPDATDPMLERFLADLTGGDEEFLAYLQRAAGYTLTGLTDEEVFFLALGPGGTGKSTFIEAMLAMLGPYASKSSFDTFLERREAGGARPDIAAMRGIRMTAAVETARRHRLAEPMLKELTGGDQVTARYLYSQPFTFKPCCKVWLAANDSPKITDTDSGIWRRLRRLPFEHVVEAPDPAVKKHLVTPAGGRALLAWAVAGALEWQRQGLGTCSRVKDATAQLRAEMDPIAEFLDEHTVEDKDHRVPRSALWAAYESWAKANGTKPISNKAWGERLRGLGYETWQGPRPDRVKYWLGIGLVSDRIES